MGKLSFDVAAAESAAKVTDKLTVRLSQTAGATGAPERRVPRLAGRGVDAHTRRRLCNEGQGAELFIPRRLGENIPDGFRRIADAGGQKYDQSFQLFKGGYAPAEFRRSGQPRADSSQSDQY